MPATFTVMIHLTNCIDLLTGQSGPPQPEIENLLVFLKIPTTGTIVAVYTHLMNPYAYHPSELNGINLSTNRK